MSSNVIVKTQEQKDIIQAIIDGKSIRVSAQAGSSKTTTLVMAAESVVKPILYLTFNKAMQEDARDKFPSWVEVRTTHSMAYAAVGYAYQTKLKRPIGGYVNVAGTASEVARFFKIRPIEYQEGKWITSAAIGYAILSTVRGFECSESDKVSEQHISMTAITTKRLDKDKHKSLIEGYRELVLHHSKALWELRSDLNSKVLSGHDTYLKLWQLSKPDLSAYDVLMVDEFQDTNMCMVDVIQNQSNQVVIVGDPSQAIYQFRGAINALDKFDYPLFSLSQSFRYGQDVADVGSFITGRKGMKGWDKIDTEVHLCEHDSDFPERYTAIYRTNSGMLADAVDAISSGKSVNIVIDIREFTALIDSALALRSGDTRKVKHQSLLVYEDWKEFIADIEWASGELQRVYAMIKDNSVYRVMGLLKGHRNSSNPDVTFVTAHKSKGLEYDSVSLGSDFPSVLNKDGERRDLPIAEVNLLYVASTRARLHLKLNEQVEERIRLGRNPLNGKKVGEALVSRHGDYI